MKYKILIIYKQSPSNIGFGLYHLLDDIDNYIVENICDYDEFTKNPIEFYFKYNLIVIVYDQFFEKLNDVYFLKKDVFKGKIFFISSYFDIDYFNDLIGYRYFNNDNFCCTQKIPYTPGFGDIEYSAKQFEIHIIYKIEKLLTGHVKFFETNSKLKNWWRKRKWLR